LIQQQVNHYIIIVHAISAVVLTLEVMLMNSQSPVNEAAVVPRPLMWSALFTASIA
jgi:hypothetical protein